MFPSIPWAENLETWLSFSFLLHVIEIINLYFSCLLYWFMAVATQTSKTVFKGHFILVYYRSRLNSSFTNVCWGIANLSFNANWIFMIFHLKYAREQSPGFSVPPPPLFWSVLRNHSNFYISHVCRYK